MRPALLPDDGAADGRAADPDDATDGEADPVEEAGDPDADPAEGSTAGVRSGTADDEVAAPAAEVDEGGPEG